MGSAASKTRRVRPYKVELKFTNGDIVMTWSEPPPYKEPYQYKVQLYERDGDIVKLVHSDMTESTQYTFPQNVWDAFTKYYAEVVRMDGVKPKCLHPRSKEIIFYKPLTKDGKVLVDYSKPLGTGHRVYEGFVKSAAQGCDKVAVKLIANLDDREVENLNELNENNHQHVVHYKMSGDVQDAIEKTTFFVMELCHRHTLRQIAHRKEFREDEVKKTALLHMMLGLNHIHKKGFVHGNLRLETVHLTLDGRYFEIADFGTRKKLSERQSEMAEPNHESWTAYWGYIQSGEIRKEFDLLSAALIFCYILSGANADDVSLDMSENVITAGKPVALPPLACEEKELASNLILKMMKYDTANSEQVLAHPFFWDNLRKMAFIIRVKDFLKTKKELSEDLNKNVNVHFPWCTAIEKSKKTSADDVVKIANGDIKNNVKPGLKVADYNFDRTTQLLRFIRNIGEHYHEYEELKKPFEGCRDKVWPYFAEIFPSLLPELYDFLHHYWSARPASYDFSNLEDFFTTPASSYPVEPPIALDTN